MRLFYSTVFLLFSFELYARDRSCKHTIDDYFAPNRFEVCNGKENKIVGLLPEISKKEKDACIASISEFLRFVAKVESDSNSCKTEIDCTAIAINDIWYFSNKERVVVAFNQVVDDWSKKEMVWDKCEEMNSIELRSWISRQDSTAPHNFKCMKNKCIPKYDGNKIDFLKITDSILKKEGQKSENRKK